MAYNSLATPFGDSYPHNRSVVTSDPFVQSGLQVVQGEPQLFYFASSDGSAIGNINLTLPSALTNASVTVWDTNPSGFGIANLSAKSAAGTFNGYTTASVVIVKVFSYSGTQTVDFTVDFPDASANAAYVLPTIATQIVDPLVSHAVLSGTGVTGNANVGRDVEIFSVAAEQGHVYRIVVTPDAVNVPTPENTGSILPGIVTRDNFLGASAFDLASVNNLFTAAATETLYISGYADGEYATGSYTITLVDYGIVGLVSVAAEPITASIPTTEVVASAGVEELSKVVKFTAAATGTLVVDTSAIVGAYDTRVTLFDVTGLVEIAVNDDISADNWFSHLEAPVTAGEAYILQIYAYTGFEAGSFNYSVTLPTASVASARSNTKFSQKSIKGLPEALAALASAVTNQGSAGSTALTDAIAAEVSARNGAISTAIAQEVLDRNSAISTAVQGVLGTAPEAFDTLKEIADYIAVNPSATVADAINAAIAAANLAVTNLTTAVDAEKAFSDYKSSQALRLKGEVLSLTGTLADSKLSVATAHAVEMVLNYGFARVTNIVLAETYDIPVSVSAGVATLDFAGYEAEVADLTQLAGIIQYAYKVDSVTERAAFAAI